MPQMDQCAYEQDPCAPSVESKPLRLRKRPQLANASLRISEADEARLTLYLGELGTRFERSVSGRILEIQEQFGSFSTRCRRCKGSGIIEGPGGFAVVVEEVQRTRQSSTQRRSIEAIPDESSRWEASEQPAATGGWCRPCNGTGSVPKTESGPPPCERCSGSGRAAAFNVRPGHHDVPCVDCLSTGRAQLTAEPTGSSVEGSDNAPSEGALTLYALTSRQLEAVRNVSDVSARAIEVLFGDIGARWARTHHGRMFALYHLTPAGKRLVKWADDRVAKEAQANLARSKVRKKPEKSPGWTNPPPINTADPFGEVHEATVLALLAELDGKAKRRPRPRRPKHLRDFIGPVQERKTWFDGADLPSSEHEKARPPLELTAQERIGSEANVEPTRPDPYRRKLLLEAAEQARQLYVRASKLWVTVGALVGRPNKRQAEREQEDREAVVRLHERFRAKGLSGAATYIAAQVKSR